MKITPRDRKFLIAGAVAIGLFVMLNYAVLPLYDSIMFKRRDIALKEMTLQKYQRKIETQGALRKKLAEVQRRSREVEQSLLKGGTTSLAAADIQRIVDTVARQSRVSIKSVKVLDAAQQDVLTTIPVQVTFDGDLTRTCAFIHSIESNAKLLAIQEMKIRVRNRRKPKGITVTLKIAGFMKKRGPEA